MLSSCGSPEKQAEPTTEITQPTITLGEYTYEEPDESNLINYNNDEYLPVPANMLLVLAKDEASQEQINSLTLDLQGEIVGEFDFIKLYQIKTNSQTQEELDSLMQKAQSYEFVEDAGPMLPLVGKDVTGESCKILDDMYTDPKNATPYEMIGLQRAWDLIHASGIKLNPVKVGVVDTGYNDETADGKKGTKIQALTKSDNKDAPDDYNTHGTSVANVIGASWDNGGMRGVAGGLGDKLEINIASLQKTKSKYTPIPTGDPNDPSHYIHSDGQAYLVNNFAEIKKQIENGAEVINYSWGSAKPGSQNHLDNAVTKKFLQKMQEKYPKVVFVAAAGNEGYELMEDPKTKKQYWVKGTPLDGTNYDMGGTKADNLITVAALDSQGKNAWFTNTVTGNGEITLAAQGTDVPLGANKDGTTYAADGTSFSTPQVSGAVAILKSINPNLTAKEIKDILTSTADTKITNPKLLPDGVKEQAISQNVGGKVMRLDKAVLSQLKVILGEKFDETKLENIARITATATSDKQDPLHFDIEASIPDVWESGTDVSVTFTGEGSLGGMSKQHISSAGNLNWDWRFLNEKNSARLTITRQDSGACTTLVLKPDNIAGTYTGEIMVSLPEYAEFLSKTVFSLPSTMIIDEKNNLNFKFAKSDSATYGMSGFNGTLKFKTTGEMTGTVAEDKSLNFTGSYTSIYQNILPSEFMISGMESQLGGTLYGKNEGSGKIVEQEITGTIKFIYSGTTTTGTFKLTKVEIEE